MTPGEQAVFDLFNRDLAPEWEIYLQPHLNGLRPDFVILNPQVGIGVFEVKDWDLDALYYFVKENESGRPKLWGSRDGVDFCLEGQNPFTKATLYKEELFNLYCPRLKPKHGFAAITAGVIFPFADARRVRELQKPFLTDGERQYADTYNPVSGRGELRSGDIRAVFPESRRERSVIMSDDHAADLRGWLVEPDFAAAQRLPLELDTNQKSLAGSRTESGYRRIKGPAGSGKSLVLAARAASLMNEGKSVLIATFNITLWHYLKDLVVRGLEKPDASRNGVYTHFHKWCADVTREADLGDEYHQLFEPVREIEKLSKDLRWSVHEKNKRLRPVLDLLLNKQLPELASLASDHPNATRYDAILVDEGQDYRPAWWNALRKCCKPGGEMLLVADATQDVYGTARSWTDEAMTGAGFPGGRWAQLSVSYRLPPDALKVARNFASRYLPNDTLELPEVEQGSLDIFPCHLRWIQCAQENASELSVNAVRAMMLETGRNGLANADITFLCNNLDFGKSVSDTLGNDGVKAVHTFVRDRQEQSRQKMAFYMGDARIKATTLHSFKGWEARLLVVHVEQVSGPESLALIYAGLTRLKRSTEGSWLTVVCSAPELAEFGRTWPAFEEGLNESRDTPNP
jgi:hypothetical protein